MRKILLLLLVTCLTAFSSFSQRVFSEDFTAASLPAGWTAASVSPNDAWAFGGSVDFGPSLVRPDASGNPGEYARLDFSLDPDTTSIITPVVSVAGLSNPRLVFSYITQTTSTSFSPYNRLIVDYWNGAGWVNITVIDTLTPSGWTKYEINLIPYKYGTDSVQIRFSGQEGGAAIGGTGTATFDQDIALDEVRIEQTPTCLAPSAQITTNISAFSADLGWTNNSSSNNVEIEYGPAGFIQGTGTILTDTVNLVNVTGLMSATNYSWYVRSICSPTDSSFWTGPNNFKTLCSFFNAPYYMDMEGETLDVPPSCWTEYETFPNGFVEVEDFTGTASPFAGTQALYIYSSSGFTAGVDTLMAISPQFADMSAGDKRIRFQANSDLVSQLVIGTMSAPGPNGVFTPLDTTTFAIADTYEEVIVNLTTANGYNGTDQYIGLMHDLGGAFDYIRIDNFNYESIPSCFVPTALNATNIGLNSADLNWTEVNSATNWAIEWGTAGFAQGSGTLVSTTSTNPYSLSGLMPGTSYDFYVKSICTVGDTSAWSNVGTFGTAFAVPYTQNFDLFPNFSNIASEGWSNSRGGSAPDWTTGNRTGSTGTGPTQDHTSGSGLFVYTETSGAGAGVVDTLTSPGVLFSPTQTSIELSYWYHMAGAAMGELQVWVDTNGVWDSLTTYVGQQQAAQTDPWLKGSHILNGYEGKAVTIHFLGVAGTSFTSDMAVDDVSLNLPPSCIEPNALVTSSIGVDSAVIGWTENNSATQWEIEYGLIGFTPGTGTTAIVTSNPFNLTGLNSSTDYGWRVRSICGAADTSLWSSPSSFKTAFQCPAGAVCATYTAGDITSDRGFTSLPGASTCADSIVLAIPSGNRIDSMSTVYDMTATSSGNAWISEQRSWLYSPTLVAGEATITNGPALNSAGTASYSRTGLSFANGATGNVVVEMHAGRTFGGTACAGGINDIDNATWIVIAYHSPLPACLEPISIVATANSTDSATVNWSDTNAVTAPSYDVSYGPAGTPAGAGTIVTVSSTTAGIGGLMPSSAYDVYVRANCGVGNSSPWSLVSSFSTFNGIPYFQDFEAFTTGSPVSEGWSNFKATNPQFLVRQGTTPSAGSGTGPTVDHTVGTATGKYVFLETSVPGVAGDADTMYSAPIIISATQNVLELSYWYHFFGATIGSLEAWVEDSSGALSQVGSIIGQQQALTTDPYLRAKHVVSGYANQQIRLVFVGVRGTSFTGDLAIDDVRLDVAPPAEIGITNILRPSSGCGLGADSVEVQITNFGSASQTGFNVGYSLNGVAIIPETVTATLGAGMSMNYTFSTTAALAIANNYEIVTYTLLTGDADATNDTLGTNVNSFAIVSAFPYATSFETGNDSWFATGDASWELGTPAGFVIDTASNGTQAWVTDLDANYGDGLDAFLTSPCFDFTGIANPAINLDIWYDIESRWDGAFMQATTDGGATWTTIGSENDLINWYNDTSRVPVDNNYSAVGDSWTGDGSLSGVNGTNGWITASHELNGLGGQASVQLRIVLATDANTNADGLGVDNIEIYDRDPSYAIGILNTEDATGVADSLGTIAWTSGVVVGIDLDGNNGISFTIIDDENGIQEGMNIFNFNDVSNYVVTEGDEILVHGDIIQFNGLTELSPDSILVLSSGNAIPTPIVVTDLDETTESRWLSIPTNWVSLSTSGAFSSNINLTNGTDTITMRIDSDTDINDSLTSSGMPIIPGDTICGLFGIGGQFDNSSPYTSGYQIFPMRWSDLSICRLSTGIESAEIASAEIVLVPNPTNGTFEIRSNGFINSTINISIRDLSGRIVASEFVNNATGNFRKSFDFNEQAKGIYFITILDGENVINKKLILQ